MNNRREREFLTDESLDDCYPDTGETGDSYDLEMICVLGIDGDIGTRHPRPLPVKYSEPIQLSASGRVE
jgi:hypothetical protein